MKLPSLTTRNDRATTYDEDGRDGAETTAGGPPVVTDRDEETRTYRSSATTTDGERAADGRSASRNDTAEGRPTDQSDAEPGREPEPPVPAGPRPRASLLATLGLVVSVAGALFVLAGALAGYGIAVGALGAVLSACGLVATRRRHVAGKTDALLGMAFGGAAVVLGVLAMTGQFAWPTTDGGWVERFREWLDSQFSARF